MINNVVLAGRLTKDPELRYTPNGVAVANFTIACNRPFSNDQGNREADFINCVVWRRPAENLANYMKKGSLVGVVGRLQTRHYDDQQTGKRVFVTEVVADSVQFLEPGGNNQGQQQNNQPNRQNNQGGYQGNNQGNNYQGQQNNQNWNQNNHQDPFSGSEPIDISDDDLPF